MVLIPLPHKGTIELTKNKTNTEPRIIKREAILPILSIYFKGITKTAKRNTIDIGCLNAIINAIAKTTKDKTPNIFFIFYPNR
jgi:hypothetical protein